MSYAIGRGLQNSQEEDYVSGSLADEISIEKAKGLFNEVLEALNVDTSMVTFDDAYGMKVNGERMRTYDYDEFVKLSTGPDGKQLMGFHNDGKVTIFRNAFSTRIHGIELRSNDSFEPGPFRKGFQAGLIVVGHELGHFYGQSNERAANRNGWGAYNRVCGAGRSARPGGC